MYGVLTSQFWGHQLSDIFTDNTHLKGMSPSKNKRKEITGFFASHCHNVFLQMAYDFGIIVGILFITVFMLSYLYNAIRFFKEKTTENHFRIFVTVGYITIFAAFGMFEIDWMYGQLPFALFWLMQYGLVHKVYK